MGKKTRTSKPGAGRKEPAKRADSRKATAAGHFSDTRAVGPVAVNPPEAGEFPIPVETEQNLSTSRLWEAQRNYFHREGIEAWRTGTVPHYITNNPALARAYAAVVLGFLRDCASPVCGHGAPGWQPLDTSEPLYILELGSGCGRFAFLFLKAFLELHRQSPFSEIPVRYIMTDLAEANLDFWRTHESLQPFFKQGVLDLARFDIEGQCELLMERSQQVLGHAHVRNPLVVIANYFFDGIPQDAFAVREGRLHRYLVSLFSDRQSLDMNDPEVFPHLAISYTARELEEEFYPEPEFNQILTEYSKALQGTTVLFPCAALRGIERLADWASGRLFLLSADKGQIDEPSLDGHLNPSLVVHGSFSLPVNYDAIGRYFRKHGGDALFSAQRRSSLAVCGFVLGQHPTEFSETRLAYLQSIERAGPDDLYNLRRGIQPHYEKLRLKHILSLIRLSGWDPKILRDSLPALWARIGGAAEAEKEELAQAVERTWENYFPVGEPTDLAFEFGSLLYALGYYTEGIRLLEESLRLHGETAHTLWNLGLCQIALGRPEEAARTFSRVLRLDPEFGVSKELLVGKVVASESKD